MQLELFLSKNDFTTNWIGIVFFNNSENDSNSKKLNYKIRDFRKWNTNLLFPVQDKEGPEKEGIIFNYLFFCFILNFYTFL